MRSTLLRACAAALVILGSGCGEEAAVRPDPASDIGGSASRVSMGLLPDGYYTAAENLNDLWFTELMLVDRPSGRGTIIAHVDIPPDPEFGGFATLFGMAFDLDGTLYTFATWCDFVPGHQKSQLARIDPATGSLTMIGEPIYNSFTGPEFDACGNLYANGFQTGCPEDPSTPVVFGDGYLYRIDKYTGEATSIGPTGHADLMDLAFDSYGTLWGTVANKLYVLDLQTGAATYVRDITGIEGHDIPGIPPEDWEFMEVMSIAFDAQGVLWGTSIKGCSWAPGNSPVVRIDTSTGAATIVGYTGQPYNHGGDIMPKTVRVAHNQGNGATKCIVINMRDLPAHLAHGDYVPGTGGHDCECP